MARTVKLGAFQEMQRGEFAADREAVNGGASLDPLSGHLANGKGPGFQSPARTVAEQLQALALQDDIAGMPLGQIDGLLRRAVAEAHVNATAAEITAEAERRWLDGKLEESAVEPKPEDRAEDDLSDLMHGAEESDYPTVSDVPCDSCGGEVVLRTIDEDRRLAQLVAEGRSFETLCDGCAAVDPVKPSARDLVATVNEDGTVAEVRPAEMTPDAGPDVGTTHHTITDDEPRFSGGGDGRALHRAWTSINESQEMNRTAPWMVLRVPTEAEFGEDEFFASTALAHRAEILTDRHPDLFGHLTDLKVVYLWKKTGGKSKGKGVYGKTAKASGLVKHFSEKAAFVIWLAADHCRGANYSERQLEALLFHEMCHTSVAEEDPETGRGGGAALVPHDVEMFRVEVEVYGLWDAQLRDVAPAFRQGHLFDAPVQRSGSAVANDGAGILIHADGTPLTDDEIEAMERHELNDDPAELPDTSGELPTGDEIDAARAGSGSAASAEGEKSEPDILLDDPV